MTQHAAIMRIRHEELLQLFGLPADAQLTPLTQEPKQVLEGVVQFLVEHPSMPEHMPGFDLRSYTIWDILARIP